MQSENSILVQQFEREIWLYLDGGLTSDKMKFWDEQIEINPQLRLLLDETIELLNIYDEKTLHDIDDPAFEKMLLKATQKRKSIFPGLLHLLGFEGEAFRTKAIVHKIAFASLLFVAAVVILLVSDKPSSVKKISSELLDWESESISMQINEIDTGISIIEDEKLDQYMLYKRTGDVWSVNVNSMRNDIEKLINETGL